MFQVNVVEEIETRLLCAVTFLENSAVCEIMWKNTVDPGRPQMTIRRKRIACRIIKATRARARARTHTHTHTLSLTRTRTHTHTHTCTRTRTHARTHSLSLSLCLSLSLSLSHTHTHTHTHTICNTSLFRCTSGCKNAPQCSVARTLPVLLLQDGVTLTDLLCCGKTFDSPPPLQLEAA